MAMKHVCVSETNCHITGAVTCKHAWPCISIDTNVVILLLNILSWVISAIIELGTLESDASAPAPGRALGTRSWPGCQK